MGARGARAAAAGAGGRVSQLSVAGRKRAIRASVPPGLAAKASTYPTLSRRRRGQRRAADFNSGPSVVTRDAQPMNSQSGKLSALPGRVDPVGITPIVCAEPLWLWLPPTAAINLLFQTLSPHFRRPCSAQIQSEGNGFTPFCRTACLPAWAAARPG